MLTPLHNPAVGRLRIIGYASGSGDTLWKAYELQKEMEDTPSGCPFEIVGVFCSKADAKALATAERLGVSHAAIDIQEYYSKRDKPFKDQDVRREYDLEALELLRPMKGDAILLAGYVWATTDVIVDNYLVINVHPADLSIEKDGKRAYAGGNGVGGALNGKEPYLCATSHLATKEIDGGPILVISERIPVDYTLHADDETRVRHYLKLVNEQARLIGARTVLEVSSGNFRVNDSGKICYKDEAAPTGIRIESWDENKPLHQRKTEKLMYPDSVAVIGASNKPGIGHCIVENILRDGFEGKVYAVNVRGEDVLGVKGYSSIIDIEEHVDLAVIATPGGAVLEVAEQCGKKGVSSVVCISAGFKEVGNEGVAAEKALVQILNRYNMRMIGPNCMGAMNIKANLNATILTNPIVKGNVAFVTQSGALGAAMLDYAEELGIGFSSMVSLGNQADITVCDLLPFYEKDEHTKVIVLYLESILEPVRFWKIASEMSKPILILKSGSTSAGMVAASSHTGSLAGNDKIVEALIKKAGITRVHSLEECFICATALANMPMAKGKRVGVLTNAGGPGILISDALSNLGFSLPKPSEKLGAYLKSILLKEASTQNPIDVVAPAQPKDYGLAARAMIDSGEYDALLICCVPPATVDTAAVAKELIPVIKDAEIPVLTNFVGPTIGKGARDILRANGIPASQYPEQLATMLAGLCERKVTPETESLSIANNVTRQAKAILAATNAGDYLPTESTYKLLELFGIHVAANKLVKSVAEAEAAGILFPVVAKIEHPEIIHKSDVGGVRLNISSTHELAGVVADFLKRFPGANGVLVQEQVPEGLELIVGSASDPGLGNAVMVGLGGVWVEVMKDVAFGYPPLSSDEAMELINSLRCEPLLAGYRGKPGVNKQTLAALLVNVSNMLLALPEIAEIDLNPVIFNEAKNAFVAADARVRKG